MAASKGSSTTHLRECAVCFEDMMDKTPKLLECKHSYCTPCLTKLGVAQGTLGLKIQCPKCKHNTFVKSGKLMDLPDDFLLQELKSVLNDQALCCFYCKKLGKEMRAVGQCINSNCHRYMCEACLDKHKKNPQFSKHEILFFIQETNEVCEKHNEPVIYVCQACSPLRLLCDVCVMLDEPCHNSEKLTDYATGLSQVESQLKSQLSQQKNLNDELLKMDTKERKMIAQLQENASSLIERARVNISRQDKVKLDMKSLRTAADAVKAAVMTAQELLKSKDKKLRDLGRAHFQLSQALQKLSEEQQRIPRYNPDLNAEFYEASSYTLLVPLQRFQADERLTLVSCMPTENTVTQLRPSRGGRVLYVCSKESGIIERSLCRDTGKILTFPLNLFITSNNCIFDTCDSTVFIAGCGSEGSCNLYKGNRPDIIKGPSLSALEVKCVHKEENFNPLDLCALDISHFVVFGRCGRLFRGPNFHRTM